MSWHRWKPYVPVARRRARAAREMDKLRTKGRDIQPVTIAGRTIARTFWGRAWCTHLEKFSDYANRLPRGRTYVCNGSVCHLEISRGRITARVSGSKLYTVDITIAPLPAAAWETVKRRCAGRIGSLLELLQGKLSSEVMAVVTDRDHGLFPGPREISLACSCPDWAEMCKHVAAAMYGVGARLDEKPELLFLLRGVDHTELIAADVALAPARGKARARIADTDLADVFGVDIDTAPAARAPAAREGSGGNGRKRAPRRASAVPATPSDSAAISGEMIRALRARARLTQAQLAYLLSVSRAAIIRWERTDGPLGLQSRTRKACAEALAMSDHEIRQVLSAVPRWRRGK